MMMSRAPSAGTRKRSFFSIQMFTWLSTAVRTTKSEAAPASSLRSVSLPTTATVRCASSPTAAGLDAMEYTRPVTGRSALTSASGVHSAG
jgi:hypothetical protein